MRILYFELYCIPCHWAVVSVLSDCLFYDILLIFVSFLPFKEYFLIRIRENTNCMLLVHLQQNWESPLDSYAHKKRKMR